MDGRINNGGKREGAGRKTAEEELAYLKEKLKKQTIEELATNKVYNHIKMTKSSDRQGIKDVVLPVYLKSKADKVENKIIIEQITGMEIKKDENN